MYNNGCVDIRRGPIVTMASRRGRVVTRQLVMEPLSFLPSHFHLICGGQDIRARQIYLLIRDGTGPVFRAFKLGALISQSIHLKH